MFEQVVIIIAERNLILVTVGSLKKPIPKRKTKLVGTFSNQRKI